jgi:hypothetical protein
MEQEPFKIPGRNVERYTEIQNSKEVISYEDFIATNIRGGETFGNFWMKFYKGYGESTKPYYQRFMESNPELEKELADRVETIAKDRTANRRILIRELAPKLYEAYKIMIGYEEITENYDLFG